MMDVKTTTDGVLEPVSDPRGHVGQASTRMWRLLAYVSVGMSALLHVYVAWSARAPSFPYDEISILQLSKLISGVGTVPYLASAGYYPGWSVVIAPLWWITDDTGLIYQGAIYIGVAVAVATIWPLSLIARRWGLTTTQSVTVAAVIMCMPSRTIQADYVLSERLLFFILAWAVIAAMNVHRRPTVLAMTWFVLAIGLAYFTHGRALPLVWVAAIWVVLQALRNWRVALVGLVLIAAVDWFVEWLALAMNDAVIDGDFLQGEQFMENVDTTTASLITQVAFAQVWHQSVATLGLFILGLLVLITLCWKDLLRGRVTASAFIFGALFAMLTLSVLAWSGPFNLFDTPWKRLDAWIYSRYADPFTALVVLLGLVALVRGVDRGIRWLSVLVFVVISVPVVVWIAPQAATWGFMTPPHVPGILPWAVFLPDQAFADGAHIVPSLLNENRFWLVATLTSGIAFVVILFLQRRPVWAIAFALAAFSGATLISNPWSDAFQEITGGEPRISVAVRDISTAIDSESPIVIEYDLDCRVNGDERRMELNNLGYWLHPNDFELMRPSQDPVTADLVISCLQWPLAEELGALAVVDGSEGESQLWVLPGELQRQLVELGLAEPAPAFAQD